MPPIEAWHRAVKRGDNLTPFHTENDIRQLTFNMLRTETRKYVENQGIKINTFYYNYQALTASFNRVTIVPKNFLISIKLKRKEEKR